MAVGVNLGIPTGLTTKIPSFYNENSDVSKATIGYYYVFFIKVFSIISVIIALGLIIFSSEFTNLLVGEDIYDFLFILGILSLIFIVLYRIVEAFLRSIEEIGIIVKISIYSSLLSLIVLVPLIIFFKIDGVALYLFVFGASPFAIFIIYYRKVITKYISDKIVKPKKQDSLGIYKLGLQSSYANFLHLGVLILIRKIIISDFGLEDNGIYQSVLGISITAFQIIYMFLLNYTLPKLSGLKSNEEINNELNNNFRFLLFMLIPMILVIFTFRDFIIILLFSESFIKATDLMFYQIIGDLFRALAALFGLWLLPKMRLKELIIINSIYNIALLCLPILFLELFGKNLIIFPISYMIAFIIQFTLYFVYSIFNIKYRISIDILKNILITVILLIISFYLSLTFLYLAYFINVILIVVWILLYLNQEEKIKIKSYINTIIKG